MMSRCKQIVVQAATNLQIEVKFTFSVKPDKNKDKSLISQEKISAHECEIIFRLK